MKNCVQIFLFCLIFCSLTGCSPAKADNTIYIWSYGDSFELEDVMNTLTQYAADKGISVVECVYSQDEITYADYLIKRNISLSGNRGDIVVENVNNMSQFKNEHTDYSKVEGYEELFNRYRNYHYIPLSSLNAVVLINKGLLNQYNVECDNVIGYEEYLGIKNVLRQKGAVFEVNTTEINELIDYHMLPYMDSITDGDDKYLTDCLLKSINNVYDDLNRYYEADLKSDDVPFGLSIYDTISNAELRNHSFIISDVVHFNNVPDIGEPNGLYEPYEDSSYLVLKSGAGNLGVYISDEANDGAYDLVSYLLSDEVFKRFSTLYNWGPVRNTFNIREFMAVDDDWRSIRNENDSSYHQMKYDVLDYYYESLNAEHQLLKVNPVVIQKYREFILAVALNMYDKDNKVDLNKKISDFLINMKILLDN